MCVCLCVLAFQMLYQFRHATLAEKYFEIWHYYANLIQYSIRHTRARALYCDGELEFYIFSSLLLVLTSAQNFEFGEIELKDGG